MQLMERLVTVLGCQQHHPHVRVIIRHVVENDNRL